MLLKTVLLKTMRLTNSRLATACLMITIMLAGRALALEPLDPTEVEVFADHHFQTTMEASGIPGVVVAIVQDGEAVLLKGYGTSDVGAGTPIDPQSTLFRLGSITKPLTAIAVLRLVEQGVLDWRTDVNVYLKEIRVPDTFGEPVTLEHLLSHTGGFDADMSFANLPPGSDYRMTSDQIQRRLQRIRAPGRVSSYDVLGFGLMGIVLRDTAGKPFREVIREHVFEPLGMDGSVVGTPPDRLDEMARCHISSRPGDARVCEHPVLTELYEGSGGVAAPAADMARLMIELLGGGQHLLSEAGFADLTDFDHYRFHPFGPGIGRSIQELDYAGRRASGHGGGINGFNNDMGLFPSHGVGIYVGVLGGPEQIYDARLSTLPDLLPDPTLPREALEADARLRSFTRLFAEQFLPLEDGLPPTDGVPCREMTEAERASLKSAEAAASIEGLYASSRYVSNNKVVNLARHTLTRRVESVDSDAILVDGNGPYVRIAPLYYENPETGRGVAFRVTDAGTYLSLDADFHGSSEKLSDFADPRFSLLPLIPALLLVLSSAVYLLPGFAGRRRHLGILSLTGGLLFLVGLLLEMELATLLVEVQGAVVTPFLWRLGLHLGLLMLLAAPVAWARNGQAPSTRWRWLAWVHVILMGVAGVHLLAFALYWGLIG